MQMAALLAEIRPNLKERRRTVISPSYEPESNAKKVYHPKSPEQRKRLKQALQDVFLFKILTPEQMEDMLDAMAEIRVHQGEEVIHQGDEGDFLYLIDRGCFVASRKDENGAEREMCLYEDKGYFGELALMQYTNRQATVTAQTAGSLWMLDRDTFKRLVLNRAYQKRLTYEGFLRTVPMLQTLIDYERANVADALTSVTAEDGQCIIRQSDAADGMYFVEDGRVRVTYRSDDQETEREIGQLGQGQYFGELALITDQQRHASVYAIGTAKFAFLDVSAFERLLGPCVELMKRSITLYEEQIAAVEAGQHPQPYPTTPLEPEAPAQLDSSTIAKDH